MRAGAAEQDQRQFGCGQGVGTGVVAVFDLQVEVSDPVIKPGFTQIDLRAQHRRQGRHVHERVLQTVAQAFFKGTAEHVLVKGRVECKQRAVADEGHEVEQGIGRITARSNRFGAQAMQQDAGSEGVVGAQQGTFKRLAQVYRPIFDDHCAYRQHLIAIEVQAAGFQIDHHPALFAQ